MKTIHTMHPAAKIAALECELIRARADYADLESRSLAALTEMTSKNADRIGHARAVANLITDARALVASWRQPVGSSLCAPVRTACADQLEALCDRLDRAASP